MRAAGLLIVLALLPACASLESESAGQPAPAAEEERENADPAARWRGAKGQRYRDAYRVCSVFTPKEIAKRYHGVAARRRPAARAHARRLYERRHFGPAFHGCLDGFRGRPPRA